jgi:hypothetical protein
MRGSKVQGRFKIDYEKSSMEEGVTDELRDPVGTEVDWYVWDEDALQSDYADWVDPVYDVSNSESGKGIVWKEPIKVPVIMGQQLRGTNIMNERGFYTTDTLRLVLGVADVNRLLPNLISDPNFHIQDRIVFQGAVFIPTRVLPRGRYKDNYSVVTVDNNQCNSEELVNFQQFLDYSN